MNEVRRMREERGPAAPAVCGRAERRQFTLLFCDLEDSVGHLGWVTGLDGDLDEGMSVLSDGFGSTQADWHFARAAWRGCFNRGG